jgi:hypothetical protein
MPWSLYVHVALFRHISATVGSHDKVVAVVVALVEVVLSVVVVLAVDTVVVVVAVVAVVTVGNVKLEMVVVSVGKVKLNVPVGKVTVLGGAVVN